MWFRTPEVTNVSQPWQWLSSNNDIVSGTLDIELLYCDPLAALTVSEAQKTP